MPISSVCLSRKPRCFTGTGKVVCEPLIDYRLLKAAGRAVELTRCGGYYEYLLTKVTRKRPVNMMPSKDSRAANVRPQALMGVKSP